MNFYRHYIGDFQRDTGHLSLAERGAYRALMDYYYATEKSLPNDVDALCRVAGAVTAQERKAVKGATAMFEVRDGALWHKRIEAELEKAGERSDTNREIALARESRKRAAKEAQKEHEPPHEESTIRALDVPRTEHAFSTKPLTLNQEETKAIPPTPRKRGEVDGFDPLSIALPGWLPSELWGEWVQSRRETRHPLKSLACKLQIEALEKWRSEGHDALEILRVSIRNGYQGLVAPKGRPNGAPKADDWMNDILARSATQ